MVHANHRRGFVTIATGDERYYRLARNLLRSYRLHCKDDIPFGILCDRENSITRDFDCAVVMEHCHCSYLDKLRLSEYSPYDETIFVDADALFLQDPSSLWRDFENMGDFCCYGKTLPTDSLLGWYDCSRLDDLTPCVQYGIQMHGGLYYFRKGELCSEIFDRALSLAKDFSRYGFLFCSKPADEPVLALSMAISGCKPCPVQNRIAFLPALEGTLSVSPEGALLLNGKPGDHVILHFANINTGRFLYRFLVDVTEKTLESGKPYRHPGRYYRLWLQCLPIEIRRTLARRYVSVKCWLKKHLSPNIWELLRRCKKGRTH